MLSDNTKPLPETMWTHHQWSSGGRINIKMSSYQYRKSHCGDKTILRPSYLHNGISYSDKTTSLYWIRALQSSPESSSTGNAQGNDCYILQNYKFNFYVISQERWVNIDEWSHLVKEIRVSPPFESLTNLYRHVICFVLVEIMRSVRKVLHKSFSLHSEIPDLV